MGYGDMEVSEQAAVGGMAGESQGHLTKMLC
jgi:hypothetical protein